MSVRVCQVSSHRHSITLALGLDVTTDGCLGTYYCEIQSCIGF